MAENWEIGFITDWDEIFSPEFQNQWLLWAENAVNSHVFFHPVLANTWINAYIKVWKMKPLFVHAKYYEITIFFPLVQITQNYRSFFRKIIAPVGFSSFDYCDPLVIGKSEEFHKGFFEILLKKIKSFDYDFLQLHGLHDNLSGDYLTCIYKEKCYFNNLLSLSNGVESLLSEMSPKNRSEHLRVERRLKELGEITFNVLNTENTTLRLDFQEFLNNYKIRWPRAYFAPGFHESLINNCLKNNMVWFSQLKLNDKSIGWALDFIWKKKCYAYMHAYDRAYISYAPGRNHLMERIKLAYCSGLEYFDLLSGSETYKSEWFREFVEINTYQTHSHRFSSQIRNRLNNLKEKFRR